MITNPKIGQEVWYVLPGACALAPRTLFGAQQVISFDDDTVVLSDSVMFHPRKWVFATYAGAKECSDRLNNRTVKSTDRMNTPETEGLELWNFHGIHMRGLFPEKYKNFGSGAIIGESNGNFHKADTFTSTIEGVGTFTTTVNADGFPVHEFTPEEKPADVPVHAK